MGGAHGDLRGFPYRRGRFDHLAGRECDRVSSAYSHSRRDRSHPRLLARPRCRSPGETRPGPNESDCSSFRRCVPGHRRIARVDGAGRVDTKCECRQGATGVHEPRARCPGRSDLQIRSHFWNAGGGEGKNFRYHQFCRLASWCADDPPVAKSRGRSVPYSIRGCIAQGGNRGCAKQAYVGRASAHSGLGAEAIAQSAKSNSEPERQTLAPPAKKASADFLARPDFFSALSWCRSIYFFC